MGLDMYLKKTKRVGDITPEEIHIVDQYFSYTNRPEEYKNSSMKEWCGIDEEDVPMDYVESYKTEYKKRYASWDIEKRCGWETIFTTIADWRKANQIHRWFVEKVQGGVDDCELYEVTEEQLEELLSICKEIKECSDVHEDIELDGYKEVDGVPVPNVSIVRRMRNTSIAELLLPTETGFFFGNTDYDEYYLANVEYTIEVLEKVLQETDFEHEIVMYGSSW